MREPLVFRQYFDTKTGLVRCTVDALPDETLVDPLVFRYDNQAIRFGDALMWVVAGRDAATYRLALSEIEQNGTIPAYLIKKDMVTMGDLFVGLRIKGEVDTDGYKGVE